MCRRRDIWTYVFTDATYCFISVLAPTTRSILVCLSLCASESTFSLTIACRRL